MSEAKTNGAAPDITVAITAHREGVIAGATARSAREAIDHVTETLGKSVEVVVVLDKADELTHDVLTGVLGPETRVFKTDEGDPGQARNHAAQHATGEYISFLDGDDLWSFNWLTEAYKLVSERPDVVAHCQCIIVFGRDRNLWWHVDSEGSLFDPGYLHWANYWDAMAFARTDTYKRFPFKANDLTIGFGHEDWHWSCLTTAAGIAHKPVPNTVHFKRRRSGSVSARVAERLGTVWPLELSK